MTRSPFHRPLDSPFVALTIAERAGLLFALLVMLMLVGVSVMSSEAPNLGVVYLAFLIYLAAIALPFAWSGFRPGIFHPVVFYVFWIGIQSLAGGDAVLAATGLPFHRALAGFSGAELNLLLAQSFLLEALAMLSLCVGYGLVPGFRVPKMPIPRPSGLAYKSLVWLGISSIGLVMLTMHSGGIEGVLMQRGTASTERVAAAIGGHWNWLAGVGVIVPLVWMAFDPHSARRPLFWVVLLASMALKFAATGSRGGTIAPIMLVGATWMLHHRRIPYRVVIIGMALSLVFAGALGEFRAATQRVSDLKAVELEISLGASMGSAIEEMQSAAGGNSGKIAILGKVPEKVDYLFGESYLSIPFVFVPSLIVGDKPDAAGKLVATRIYERPLTAIPPGSAGEAFWNFSYAGVVFVFLSYGLILKFFSSLYLANTQHSLIVLLFVYVLFNLRPHSPTVYDFFQLVIPAVFIWATMLVKGPRFVFKPNMRASRLGKI